MYVVYNNTTYAEIKRLVFSPEVQAVSNELMINEFTVDIVTDDAFDTGDEISLYDDDDNLWAKYWIAFAERADAETVQVVAKSALFLLDRKKLPAVMYNNDSVATVIAGLFQPYGNIYTLAQSFNAVVISGYCPEQTARERLQWICFVISACVNTCFTDKLQILSVDTTSVLIPDDKTFWRPSLIYNDYVTDIHVIAYNYEVPTPQDPLEITDNWVEVEENGASVVYRETSYDHWIHNPDAPNDAPENVIEVSGLTLINEDLQDYQRVLGNLAAYYFARLEVSAEILDNGEYKPGDMCIVNTGDMLVRGFLKSTEFSFGYGIKAKATIVQALERASGILTIRYMLNGVTEIDRAEYRYPMNTTYQITNPWIDRWIFEATRRRIYYPEYEEASGSVLQQYVTDDQTYFIAAEYRVSTQKLYLDYVDSVEFNSGVLKIG